jgi:hypothetical protein
VHPSDLRFTQDSIRVTFKAPFDSTRIDDAVDKIISGEWTASMFACICIVEVDGILFSLDNRRLWVFRKAALSSITVKLKKARFNHPRLQFTYSPRILKRMKRESFFPRVQGKVRQTEWSIHAAVNVERNILISSAKEHQLPPVHKVSKVHHACALSRIPVDEASGESGKSSRYSRYQAPRPAHGMDSALDGASGESGISSRYSRYQAPRPAHGMDSTLPPFLPAPPLRPDPLPTMGSLAPVLPFPALPAWPTYFPSRYSYCRTVGRATGPSSSQ